MCEPVDGEWNTSRHSIDVPVPVAYKLDSPVEVIIDKKK